MSETSAPQATGTRGPAEHTIRDQIVEAADEHFRHYGYAKTTVADLAKAIGFSKAYIYRFFESKQAIGEAICTNCLEGVRTEIQDTIDAGNSATEKFRLFVKSITTTSVNLFFSDRKLYEIAAFSVMEKWASSQTHIDTLNAMLRDIILEGRKSGEFERKTPLDETCRAIFYAMFPFVDPLTLERNLDLLPDGPNEVTGLVLRSLAP